LGGQFSIRKEKSNTHWFFHPSYPRFWGKKERAGRIVAQRDSVIHQKGGRKKREEKLVAPIDPPGKASKLTVDEGGKRKKRVLNDPRIQGPALSRRGEGRKRRGRKAEASLLRSVWGEKKKKKKREARLRRFKGERGSCQKKEKKGGGTGTATSFFDLRDHLEDE